MVTVTDVQNVLDTWWQNAERPRLSRIRAFLCNHWSGADRGYVRVTLVTSADGLGTAIQVELEKQDHTIIIREFRPATVRSDGMTLDDITEVL